MGSVRPVRRFDALRALADRDLPSRPKPDGGPPRAFAPVQRSIAALPHRPADRSRHVERCFLPWAFEPYDTCGTADPRFAGLPAPRRAASGVWVPPSRRPPPFLAALAVPQRPSASRFKAFSPHRSGPLSEPPALVALLASIRLAPLGSVRTRSTSGRRSRRGYVLRPHPCGRGPSWPSWGSPFRAFSPSVLGPGFGSRGLPSHARRQYVTSTACVSGSCGAKGSACPSRGCRLSWDSSPCDRRGVVPTGPRGGFMVSPHGSRAACAANRS